MVHVTIHHLASTPCYSGRDEDRGSLYRAHYVVRPELAETPLYQLEEDSKLFLLEYVRTLPNFPLRRSKLNNILPISNINLLPAPMNPSATSLSPRN